MSPASGLELLSPGVTDTWPRGLGLLDGLRVQGVVTFTLKSLRTYSRTVNFLIEVILEVKNGETSRPYPPEKERRQRVSEGHEL